MRHTLYIFAALWAVAVAFTACGEGTAYDRYASTSVEGWDRTDTVVFCVPKLQQGGRYRQELGLRANAAYPFTSLSLLVERIVEPGHRFKADTLDCRIYDGKGNAAGDGVSYFQYSFILGDEYLNEGDSVTVRIRHIMRRETLTGIADVGFKMTLGHTSP